MLGTLRIEAVGLGAALVLTTGIVVEHCSCAPAQDEPGASTAARFGAASTLGGMVERQKAVASSGSPGDNFGNSVSIENDVTVVAAWLDDEAGIDAGAAYVFERQGATWSQSAKLVAADGAAGDWLGTAVDVSGSRTVVCAVNDDDNGSNSGSAYIFEKEGGSWNETAKLVASDGAALDWFGFFAGISGNSVVVTANRDDDLGANSGSAYVFRKQAAGWVETTKLNASDGAAGDQFGYSVSIDGRVIALSSPFEDEQALDAGAVYVFEFVTGAWTETAKLTASDGAAGDNLGTSVEVQGDVIFVGARNADARGTDSGEGYVFRRVDGVWEETARLIAEDGASGDAFGDVSGSSHLLVVGASKADAPGLDSGKAYLFGRQGTHWFPAGTLRARNGTRRRPVRLPSEPLEQQRGRRIAPGRRQRQRRRRGVLLRAEARPREVDAPRVLGESAPVTARGSASATNGTGSPTLSGA